MKFLFCIHTPKNENTAVYGIYQSKKAYCEQQGWEAEVLTPEDFPKANLIGRRIYLFYPFYVMQYLRKSKTEYDVIIFHSYAGWVFNIMRLFIAKLRTPTVITTFHGLEPLFIRRMIQEHEAANQPLKWYFKFFHGWFLNWLIKCSCRLSDNVYCLNKTEKTYLTQKKYQKPSRIYLHANEVDESFAAPKKYNQRVENLLFVGPWLITKGTRYLIEAFTRLASENSKLKLTIIGTFKAPEEIQADFPQKLRDRVVVHPEVAHSEILKIYRAADLFISPSLSEGASRSLIEAAMTGTPLVTTPSGNSTEFLEHEKSAWFVPYSDANAIVTAVKTLDQKPALRETIGRSGQNAVANRFSTHVVWKEWADCCIALHAKRNKPANPKPRLLFVIHTPKNMNTAVYRGYYSKKKYSETHGWEADILTPQDVGAVSLIGREVYLWYPVWVLKWLLTGGKRYDVIVFHSYAGWVFNLVRNFLPRFKKTAIITAFHGVEPLFIQTMIQEYAAAGKPLHWYFKLYHGWFLNLLIRLSCRFSDAVFCHNQREYLYLAEKGYQKSANIFTFDNDVPLSFNIERTYRTQARQLLFVGQWQITKGTRYLIQAFEKIAAEDPLMHLTLAGTLTEAVSVYKDCPPVLADKITVIPQISHEAMLEQFRNADVFIFPSLSEGFGRALLEAMMTGLPVISTPNGVVPDYFTHKENIWLVPFRDPKAIADAVLLLRDEQKLRERMGQRAQYLTRTSFSSEPMLKLWTDQCLKLRQAKK